jgi:pimeloyl-ACP methyl ester carboxylesterase
VVVFIATSTQPSPACGRATIRCAATTATGARSLAGLAVFVIVPDLVFVVVAVFVGVLLLSGFIVLAPDLPGHGNSSNPLGDYSLGSHASSMRDLLHLLSIERVTVVGQSFGGGVAMQFAYQFPGRCERLVLVDAFSRQ